MSICEVDRDIPIFNMHDYVSVFACCCIGGAYLITFSPCGLSFPVGEWQGGDKSPVCKFIILRHCLCCAEPV